MTKSEARELVARYTPAIPSDKSVEELMKWERRKFSELPSIQ